MPQIPKHIPIQMLFIVCNFKMPHPIHDILFLVHTVHLQLEIRYAFPTPPTTSSPSLFRGCTFRSFGRSLPFRYASQIFLKLHTAIKSLFHFFHCPWHSNLLSRVSLSDTDCEQRLLWLRLIFLVFLLLA